MKSLRLAVHLHMISALVVLANGISSAQAQTAGGVLRVYHRDNPPSASLLGESTISAVVPFMIVFNNLVVFDNAQPHESLESIVPDIATSWAWDESGTKLTFKLSQGVK